MFREVAEINKEVNVDREEKEAQGLMSLLEVKEMRSQQMGSFRRKPGACGTPEAK